MDEMKFPALEQFLGGYFNQDFLDDYSTPDEALEAFVRENANYIQPIVTELTRLIPLIEHMEEPGLFIWKKLGCYYRPEAGGYTVAGWLIHVRDKLKIHQKPKGSLEI